jgi:transcriptional regulator with XRE-family HTH domain
MKLKAFRERAGVSLDLAAEDIGVSKSTLWRIENHRSKPLHENVQRIEKWAALVRERDAEAPQIDWSWTSRPLKAARRRK